jgi:seryl-tRNA synthetase
MSEHDTARAKYKADRAQYEADKAASKAAWAESWAIIDEYWADREAGWAEDYKVNNDKDNTLAKWQQAVRKLEDAEDTLAAVSARSEDAESEYFTALALSDAAWDKSQALMAEVQTLKIDAWAAEKAFEEVDMQLQAELKQIKDIKTKGVIICG